MTQEELLSLLAKTLRYTPIVYNQSIYTTNRENFDNVFSLEYKHTDLPEDGLLFFVPSISSNSSGNCTLRVRIPYIQSGDSSYSYSNRDYTIVKETNDGVTAMAGLGDIVANRMCIFRFRKNSSQIVLINSPLYNSANFSKLKATDAEFINVPTIQNLENPSIPIRLATNEQISMLEQRIAKLEQRIVFGTGEPEEVLADRPAGTLFIQVEED